MTMDQSAREFSLDDREFNVLRRMVTENTGITLADSKRDLVYSRLSRRLRELGLEGFRDYIKLLEGGDDREMVAFVNAITTNVTSFFREPHHFECLAETVLPELLETNCDTRRIRIWSAGCSSGPEPYSIAMVLKETVPDAQAWDCRILATDLDSDILARAQRGIYEEAQIRGISKARLRRWFRKGRGENEKLARVIPELQESIVFRQLNLMHKFPMRAPMDVIFCRNVVIYFSKETQKALFDRFADVLAPGRFLFVGHSESLINVTDRFEFCGRNVYRRVP